MRSRRISTSQLQQLQRFLQQLPPKGSVQNAPQESDRSPLVPRSQVRAIRKFLQTLPTKRPDPSSDDRSHHIEEFLLARSLSPKSQKAYRQDLQTFLQWTSHDWQDVTPHQIAQFKAYLMRPNAKTGQAGRSAATVRRILGTVRNFYAWMVRSRYLVHNPALEIQLPKTKEPEAQNLKDREIQKILAAAQQTSSPERDVALIQTLLHGLRASEAVALNYQDYDGQRLRIRQAKADSKGVVPLSRAGRSAIETYLDWRSQQGEMLSPKSPLFVSYSRRNFGDRLSYDGLQKLMKALSQAVGFDFHAHQFRHTFATNLVLRGMDSHHVMTLTRHRSPQNFRRYTKAADQVAAEKAFYAVLSEGWD